MKIISEAIKRVESVLAHAKHTTGPIMETRSRRFDALANDLADAIRDIRKAAREREREESQRSPLRS